MREEKGALLTPSAAGGGTTGVERTVKLLPSPEGALVLTVQPSAVHAGALTAVVEDAAGPAPSAVGAVIFATGSVVLPAVLLTRAP